MGSFVVMLFRGRSTGNLFLGSPILMMDGTFCMEGLSCRDLAL